MEKVKRLISVLLIVSMMFSCVACSSTTMKSPGAESSNTVTAEKPIRLTMQAMGANTIPAFKMYQEFCEDVKTASNGRLIIDLKVLGAIAEYNDTFNAVRDGTLDLAAFATAAGVGLMGNQAYLLGAAGSPGGIQPDEMLGWTYAGGGEELMKPIFEKHGVTYVSLASVAMAEIFCHSNVKLETVDDFKGIKFRTMGMWGDVLKSVGTSVVNISGNELYSAAEKGIIDAFEYVGPMANYRNGYHEICKYVGLPGVHSTLHTEILICNNDVYEKIPEDLRMILYNCAKATALESPFVHAVDDAEGLDLLKAAGVEIFYLSDEAQKEFVELAAGFHKQWMAEDPVYEGLFMSQKKYIETINYQNRELQTPISVYEMVE